MTCMCVCVLLLFWNVVCGLPASVCVFFSQKQGLAVRAFIVHTYYSLLSLLLPQPDELLVLP